jgi:hypothetical protein
MGTVTDEMVTHEMSSNHVRKDAVSVVSKVRPVCETLAALPA